MPGRRLRHPSDRRVPLLWACLLDPHLLYRNPEIKPVYAGIAELLRACPGQHAEVVGGLGLQVEGRGVPRCQIYVAIGVRAYCARGWGPRQLMVARSGCFCRCSRLRNSGSSSSSSRSSLSKAEPRNDQSLPVTRSESPSPFPPPRRLDVRACVHRDLSRQRTRKSCCHSGVVWLGVYVCAFVGRVEVRPVQKLVNCWPKTCGSTKVRPVGRVFFRLLLQVSIFNQLVPRKRKKKCKDLDQTMSGSGLPARHAGGIMI